MPTRPIAAPLAPVVLESPESGLVPLELLLFDEPPPPPLRPLMTVARAAVGRTAANRCVMVMSWVPPAAMNLVYRYRYVVPDVLLVNSSRCMDRLSPPHVTVGSPATVCVAMPTTRKSPVAAATPLMVSVSWLSLREFVPFAVRVMPVPLLLLELELLELLLLETLVLLLDDDELANTRADELLDGDWLLLLLVAEAAVLLLLCDELLLLGDDDVLELELLDGLLLELLDAVLLDDDDELLELLLFTLLLLEDATASSSQQT